MRGFLIEKRKGGKSGSYMFKRECGGYIVIEHNGDVYPCDFFVKPEWKLEKLPDSILRKDS